MKESSNLGQIQERVSFSIFMSHHAKMPLIVGHAFLNSILFTYQQELAPGTGNSFRETDRENENHSSCQSKGECNKSFRMKRPDSLYVIC